MNDANKSKVYVGNLDYDITGNQLGEIFAQAGNVVDATVITDRRSGRSKGFGFVEFSSPDEAQNAIQMLNGTEVEGRTIKVDLAKPKRNG